MAGELNPPQRLCVPNEPVGDVFCAAVEGNLKRSNSGNEGEAMRESTIDTGQGPPPPDGQQWLCEWEWLGVGPWGETEPADGTGELGLLSKHFRQIWFRTVFSISPLDHAPLSAGLLRGSLTNFSTFC